MTAAPAPATPPLALEPASLVAIAVPRYAVPKHPAPCDLFLDGNEGQGPPASLVAAWIAGGADDTRRYPSPAALEVQLAAREGVEADQVLVTAGADDAIDRVCRAMLGAGREIVLPVPTFEMIARYARVANGRVVEVAWGDGPWPREGVIQAVTERTAVVAVVSPNNPTGGTASVDDLEAIARAAPHALVLVDLAYAEFDDGALSCAARDLPNVVAVRTLSKAWGLAGLRVGYAMGDARVIAWLRAAGAPYAVAGPSLAVASRWLSEGELPTRAFVARVRAERDVLASDLRELGARCPASAANFVLGRFRDAAFVRDALAGLGIAVRCFPGSPELRDALRITLPGDDASLARLRAALRAALRPEALLFDLDGVLADTSASYRRAIVDAARSFGVDVTLEEVAAAKRAGDANDDWSLTHRLVRGRGVRASLEEVTARFESLYQGDGARRGYREGERLLCDPARLRKLAARVPLGIVTGRPRADAEAFLARFDLRGIFRVVVTREGLPLKPDPAPVCAALGPLGVTGAWMIGDTPDDMRAARRAGVVPLGIVAPGDDAGAAQEALLAAGAARVLPSLDVLEELLP